MEPFSVVIIEDTENIRIELKDFLVDQEEICEVFDFESMEDFFKAVNAGLHPDMILSDIGLPGMDGINGIKLISQKLPDADVIMLTVFRDGTKIFDSLCAGATGYLLKGTPMPEIKNAIIEIRNGGSYMTPSIARKVVEHFKVPTKKIGSDLTSKEKEVVNALVDGLSYKLIADRLFISVDAVRSRIKIVYKKLHVNSKSEVVSKVLKGEV
jgi:DNA-binding NarL/FixJ family response regulator